jgi:hypothetical protein
MSKIIAATFLASSIISFTACVDSEPTADELGGEADIATDDAKADGAGNAGYYWIESTKPQTFVVHRANMSSLVCPDGQRHAGCEINRIDSSAIAFKAGESAKLTGRFNAERNTGHPVVMVRGKLDGTTFVASEAWLQHADLDTVELFTSSQVAVKIKGSKAQCHTIACPTITESKLNSTKVAKINRLDVDDNGAADIAMPVLREGGTVIVIGERTMSVIPDTHIKINKRNGVAIFVQLGQ